MQVKMFPLCLLSHPSEPVWHMTEVHISVRRDDSISKLLLLEGHIQADITIPLESI